MSDRCPVSFVILTCNRKATLLRLVDQLAALDDPDVDVIVIDNGGTDGTAAELAATRPAVHLVVVPENRGVGSRNLGLARARGEVIVTLDDDMVDFGPGQLAAVRHAFAADPRLGAVTFTVTWPGTRRVRDWVHRRPIAAAGERFPTYELTEGAVAFRRAALEASGPYREDFFISHEGLELAYRLLDAGWDIVHDGSIVVGHDHQRAGRHGWRRYYYDTRNLFWVAVLHQPAGYAAGYLVRGLGAMLVYSLRDGHPGAWLRAVGDGLGRVRALRPERRPWTPRTEAWVRAADRERPRFWHLARKRLAQRDFSLD